MELSVCTYIFMEKKKEKKKRKEAIELDYNSLFLGWTNYLVKPINPWKNKIFLLTPMGL